MKKQRRIAGFKKILTILLCAALVFGLAGCGGKKKAGGTTKTPTYQAEFDPYYGGGFRLDDSGCVVSGGQSGFPADVSDLWL